MIGYTPLPAGQSGGITGALGMNAWSAGAVVDLDTLISQGAVVKAAYSARKLRQGFAGQCCKLRGNGTGTPEADIPFTNGALDKSAVAALIASGGGTTAYWKTWYEQSGNGVDATQNTSANQVNYSETVFSTGGVGGAAQSNCWLESIDGALLMAPFAIWAVCCTGTYAGLIELAYFGLNGVSRNSSPQRRLIQNWGVSFNSAATGLITTKLNLLAVSNGASSTSWVNGVLKLTGDAGSNSPSGAMRIGASSNLPPNSWFAGAGASIAEIIVFGSDPSALPGWAGFVAGSKSYFGTA